MTDTAQAASSLADRTDRSAAAVVQLEQVVKAFGSVLAVDHLDLEIRRGEFFSMLGPSGCGKTTTLRIIGGVGEPTPGGAQLPRQEIPHGPPLKPRVNTGFPSDGLLPPPTVLRTHGLGLR